VSCGRSWLRYGSGFGNNSSLCGYNRRFRGSCGFSVFDFSRMLSFNHKYTHGCAILGEDVEAGTATGASKTGAAASGSTTVSLTGSIGAADSEVGAAVSSVATGAGVATTGAAASGSAFSV